jgi:hypothetical protein
MVLDQPLTWFICLQHLEHSRPGLLVPLNILWLLEVPVVVMLAAVAVVLVVLDMV